MLADHFRRILQGSPVTRLLLSVPAALRAASLVVPTALLVAPVLALLVGSLLVPLAASLLPELGLRAPLSVLHVASTAGRPVLLVLLAPPLSTSVLVASGAALAVHVSGVTVTLRVHVYALSELLATTATLVLATLRLAGLLVAVVLLAVALLLGLSAAVPVVRLLSMSAVLRARLLLLLAAPSLGAGVAL